ncbi:hypothetical protein BASA60_010597 [Batrachochytrium salamandrivorans]|nr:hypothetical protein BASA60_010597 [Batrachochytrium salamandrivorans]
MSCSLFVALSLVGSKHKLLWRPLFLAHISRISSELLFLATSVTIATTATVATPAIALPYPPPPMSPILQLQPRDILNVYVNRTLIRETNPDPKESLIEFLRRHGLTGTKLGCAEGGCGSCTVLVSRYDYQSKGIKSESLNACLIPACAVHNKHVVTIEGLGTADNLHPAQAAIAYDHGSQCGFCTPGIVMSLYTELKNNPNATDHDIEEAFDGNLCRCTGYRPILDGAKKLSAACRHDCGSCEVKDTCMDVDIEEFGKNSTKKSNFDSHDVPFPKELFKWHTAREVPETYTFFKDSIQWFHPSSIDDLLDVLDKFPKAKLIHGNSEVGIEVRFKNQNYETLINIADMNDLKNTVVTDDGVSFGAATTITSLQQQLMSFVSTLEPSKVRGFQALIDNIKYFAGRQVRNVSSVGGNICTASPISDLNPVWVSMGAVLTVRSKANGERKIPMREFYLGYRKTALLPSEAVISIFAPFSSSLEFIVAYKQSKRRDDDIAIVNAALSVTLSPKATGGYTVSDGCFSFGGMGPTTLIAVKTMDTIRGQTWSKTIIDQASLLLLQDMPMGATAPGGQIEFRKSLAQSFMAKFVMHVCHALSESDSSLRLASNEVSALQLIDRPLSSGVQVVSESTNAGAVGKSIIHASATKQVTGEANYLDDIPPHSKELHGVIVGSTISRGHVKSVDASAALAYPGVVDFITAKDVEASGATETEPQARAASKLVKIQYESLAPIITMESAIAAESFFDIERRIKTGEFDPKRVRVGAPLSDATHHVQGTTRMSAQEHFYLETQGSLVVPNEDEYEIYSSTQNPTETQHLVAHVLGIPSHRVVCRVKRLGGGFGGKETRSVFIACALAVAARKLRVPVRCVLTREEDMTMSGTRHPFLADYDIGFTDEGKLISAKIDIYCNGGYSLDLSVAVLERCLTHCDNSYYIPNMDLNGRICKTNMPTNTAFRGFGGPQGMMIAEQYITHVAEYLGKPVEDIRRLNFYKDGQITHFSMPLEKVFLDRSWNEVMASSDFKNRLAAVQDFNRAHKYRKRGITAMPTKFGLAFTARFLNQAGALVHVYADGSVRLSHGGTEMGQGLHTKMIQIAAHAFGIDVSNVHISETRTDLVANTSATAASVSSDLNGMAVLNACQQILDRLKPIKESHPESDWNDTVKRAYFDRINLSANGFYATPDLSHDWVTNTGKMFNYFTYGAAVTEVEIDTLTGDHVVLRSDINMDIGRPINPAIDIGQIEGAFTQGLGWCTIEEPLVSPATGFHITRGPGMYKIPGFKDIPADFRVTVMDGVRNERAVHSSKAVGEPPLFLGASVLFAIREAVRAARSENGHSNDHFRMDSPATSERIRIACQDVFVQQSSTPLQAGELAWGVAS